MLSLLVGLCLLLASVDNVPDSPELLTKRSCASASLQIVSVNPAFELFGYRQPAPSRIFNLHSVDLSDAAMPASAPRALRHAADTSPPA